MNWGKGITITLVAFIAFIVTLGVKMMRADADLVSEDYYKKEVEFGAEITAQENAQSQKVQLSKEVSEDGVMFTLTATQVDNGSILLRRSNDPSMDVTEKLEGTHLFVDGSQLEKGKYDIIVNWEHKQQPYQLRDVLWIP